MAIPIVAMLWLNLRKARHMGVIQEKEKSGRTWKESTGYYWREFDGMHSDSRFFLEETNTQ